MSLKETIEKIQRKHKKREILERKWIPSQQRMEPPYHGFTISTDEYKMWNTGIKDNNGEHVFELDIIESNEKNGMVEYDSDKAAFVVDDELLGELSNIQITGNFYED